MPMLESLRPRCSPATASSVCASSMIATSYSGSSPIPRLAQRQVGDEQGVVHDQDVGVLGTPPRRVEEALCMARALFAQAVAVFALNGLPHTGIRPIIEIGAAAVLGSLGPAADRMQLVGISPVGEQSQLMLKRHIQPPQADVVRPALDQNRRKLLPHDRAQKRDVLADELLLKGDRMRRDDDLRLELDRGLDRRHQVGKALAHARAGLDDQMAWAFRSHERQPRPSRAARRDARMTRVALQ